MGDFDVCDGFLLDSQKLTLSKFLLGLKVTGAWLFVKIYLLYFLRI